MNGLLKPWVMDILSQLAAPPAAYGKARTCGNGRVLLVFASGHSFLPKGCILPIFESVEAMGIELLTTYHLRGTFGLFSHPLFSTLLSFLTSPPPFAYVSPLTNAQTGPYSVPKILSSYGLLSNHVLFSYDTNATLEDASLIEARNAHISSTSSVELSMGLSA
jgi:hypothetical protein